MPYYRLFSSILLAATLWAQPSEAQSHDPLVFKNANVVFFRDLSIQFGRQVLICPRVPV
jgi:hypothetical protein